MNIFLLSCVYIFTIIVMVLFVFLIILYLLSKPYPQIEFTDSESRFVDAKDPKKSYLFPSLTDSASIHLSIIVPAYNEELRLPAMLDEALEYLTNREKNDSNFTYEIIIVDDGSGDGTTKTGLKYGEMYGSEKIRVLTLSRNRGKGGAVRMGVLSSRGRFILFADADGATKFSDIDKVEKSMKTMSKRNDSMAVVCGSRAHLEKESLAKRSLIRSGLMVGFHFLVWFLCVRSIKDTQCGFKLFTRSAASLLFLNLHVERWAFDVDLLYLAEYFKIPITEVPVTWEEIEGSKIIPVFSWLQMGKDLLLIRLRYGLGAWKIRHRLKSD